MSSKYNINELVHLRDIEKLKWNEIQERLGVSHNTLRIAYKRFKTNKTSHELNPNSYVDQKIRGVNRRIDLIKLKGGKCEICGYDKNYSALVFHHKDPLTKSFSLNVRQISAKSMDVLMKEVEKCSLLCCNCHAELHYPHMEKSNIENLPKEINEKRAEHKKERAVEICPECGKEFTRKDGKIFCSYECRMKHKKLPSYEEITEKYNELESWDKVAVFFGVTRKVIRGIRSRV